MFDKFPSKYELTLKHLYSRLIDETDLMKKIEKLFLKHSLYLPEKNKGMLDYQKEAYQLYFDSIFDLDKHNEYVQLLFRILDTEEIDTNELIERFINYYGYNYTLV